jgi:hypothetical protein
VSAEFPVAASSTFLTILEKKLVHPHTFTQTFLQSILSTIDSRDPGTDILIIIFLHSYICMLILYIINVKFRYRLFCCFLVRFWFWIFKIQLCIFFVCHCNICNKKKYCMFLCMYIYVCMHIHARAHTHTHTHTHICTVCIFIHGRYKNIEGWRS